MKQEIATYSKERALKLVELLLECGYVCMLSNEENLFLVDFIETLEYSTFTPNEDSEANRNGVVFMSKEDFEEQYCELKGEDDE